MKTDITFPRQRTLNTRKTGLISFRITTKQPSCGKINTDMITTLEEKEPIIHPIRKPFNEKTLREQLEEVHCFIWPLAAGMADRHGDYRISAKHVHQLNLLIKSLLKNAGSFSDGYHTFDELYEHRHLLFLSLMKEKFVDSWISVLHDDGTHLDGWFIAGINLPSGTITYHLPFRLWELACKTGAKILPKAPKWDGHTSADVLERLQQSI